MRVERHPHLHEECCATSENVRAERHSYLHEDYPATSENVRAHHSQYLHEDYVYITKQKILFIMINSKRK